MAPDFFIVKDISWEGDCHSQHVTMFVYFQFP